MLNFRKKTYSLYLATLTFIELYLKNLFFILLDYCIVLSFAFFKWIHFDSMLLDSKLLASSNTSEGSSKNKPSIYEIEIDNKRTSLLTDEQYDDERFQDPGEDEETTKKTKKW